MRKARKVLGFEQKLMSFRAFEATISSALSATPSFSYAVVRKGAIILFGKTSSQVGVSSGESEVSLRGTRSGAKVTKP